MNVAQKTTRSVIKSGIGGKIEIADAVGAYGMITVTPNADGEATIETEITVSITEQLMERLGIGNAIAALIGPSPVSNETNPSLPATEEQEEQGFRHDNADAESTAPEPTSGDGGGGDDGAGGDEPDKESEAGTSQMAVQALLTQALIWQRTIQQALNQFRNWADGEGAKYTFIKDVVAVKRAKVNLNELLIKLLSTADVTVERVEKCPTEEAALQVLAGALPKMEEDFLDVMSDIVDLKAMYIRDAKAAKKFKQEQAEAITELIIKLPHIEKDGVVITALDLENDVEAETEAETEAEAVAEAPAESPDETPFAQVVKGKIVDVTALRAELEGDAKDVVVLLSKSVSANRAAYTDLLNRCKSMNDTRYKRNESSGPYAGLRNNARKQRKLQIERAISAAKSSVSSGISHSNTAMVDNYKTAVSVL